MGRGVSTSRQSAPPSPHAAALLCMNYRGNVEVMRADRPRAVSLFPLKGFQPASRSGGGGGGGGGGVGGPEGGTLLHSLQEYFFFDSFKMSVIKRAVKRKEEKL